MDLIDLEMYRWEWFHKIHLKKKRVQNQKKLSGGHRMYWKEYGAFVSTFPRQSGKTTMLSKLAIYFANKAPPEKYIILVPRDGMKKMSMMNCGISTKNICTVYEFKNILQTGFLFQMIYI